MKKIKINFKKKLDEYKEKLEKTPEDKRCEVHPQIGTPIIEKLTYTTNEEIADLFTTLLANASSVDMVNTAHPSFVSVIERISLDEARIIKCFRWKKDWEYCDFNANVLSGNGYNTIMSHLTLIEESTILSYPQNINAYFSNLICLGLITDMAGIYKMNKEVYDKIEQKYGLERIKQELVPIKYKSIDVDKSFYHLTDFGKLFIEACIR